jgi:hypothetical protein
MKTKYYSLCALTITGVFFAATARVQAQTQLQANLQADISFSALPDSAGTNQPSGVATYFENGWNYDTESPESNVFVVSINLGTSQATDGWILQKEDDGSFTPVMELTNEIYNVVPIFPGSPAGTVSGDDGDTVGTFPGNGVSNGTNYYSQFWQLTDDQIQNLLAGKWYVEVDYGDDKYIGNITPTIVNSPQAAIAISPSTTLPLGLGTFPGVFTGVVIAPNNNQTATVTLNGGNSTDPFGLPLHFLWQDGNNYLAATKITANKFQIGTHQVTLEVNDGYNSDIANLVLEVVSPAQAVSKLYSTVEQSKLNRTRKMFLASVLSQAENAFNRNNTGLAAMQLVNFQNQVRLQIGRSDSADANLFTESAQEIIDAVGQQQNRRPIFRF